MLLKHLATQAEYMPINLSTSSIHCISEPRVKSFKMSPTVKISSANEFSTLLRTSNVVITDCKRPFLPRKLSTHVGLKSTRTGVGHAKP